MFVPEIPDSAVLFVVNKNYDPKDTDPDALYKAVRYAWHLDPERVEYADYILPVYRQTIKGAFVAHRWTLVNPEVPRRFRRYAFDGEEAPPEVFEAYEGMPLPEILKRGRNPVKYANC
ncbi:MAG: hypothetical protein OXH16_01315 [Gemmatimonadetes bacterium]|nr:hypothetical protein [Gemmatimonadota bacterium]